MVIYDDWLPADDAVQATINHPIATNYFCHENGLTDVFYRKYYTIVAKLRQGFVQLVNLQKIDI